MHWLEGEALDLIVTPDDVTGAIYSVFWSRRKARPDVRGAEGRPRSTACR